MIPKTGPISIEDFKATHGCYAPMGNPEFGGASSSSAPFELSSIYTRTMVPYFQNAADSALYAGVKQNMNDNRGCVASLNRENYGTDESAWSYPGRTFVYYANRAGTTAMSYAIVADGASGRPYSDPFGTNVRSRISGKATSSATGGTNSSVMFNMHFYLDRREDVAVKFMHRFTFAGTGPAEDPTPPNGFVPRQGTFLLAVEYKDIWNGSDSRVVSQEKLLSFTNANSADVVKTLSFKDSTSDQYPYKLISFQMNNHGHPTTDRDDTFSAYWGNFAFQVI